MALPAVQGKTREGRHSLPGRAGRLRSRGEEDRRQGELDARRRVSFLRERARSRWQRRAGPPAAGWPRCALCSRSRGQEMFEKAHIDALFSELERQWRESPEFDRLARDAHLGIALCDAGRPLKDRIDPKIVALIEKHRPKA